MTTDNVKHGAPESKRNQRGEIKELQALIYLLRPYRVEALGWISATILLGIAFLVPSYLSKVLIDVGLEQSRTGVVIAAAVASALLVAVTWTLQRTSTMHSYNIGARAVVSLQGALFRKLMRLPPSYHEARPVGHTVSRLTNDVLATQKLITTGLPSLLTSLVSVLGALIMMFVLDWDLALVTLSVVPVFVLISWIYRRWVGPRFVRWRETIGTITNNANETLGAIRIVQSYNQEERHWNRFYGAATDSRQAEYLTMIAAAIYYPATAVLTAVATGLLIIYGGTQVVRGESQVGTMVAFFGYLQLFLGPLANFSSIFRTYQSGMASLDRVFEVMDESIGDGPTSSLPDLAGAIDIAAVSFEKEGRTVLDAIDLTVEAGSIVAFVGDGASGREEIARIVASLDPPSTGVVRYDGIDGQTIARESLFNEVGYVSQLTGLLDGTVRDNLLLADADASDERLARHLTELFGAGLVSSLGQGLDTPVGRGGRDVPAGVGQALVIARALLKEPRILVLDGAADSLDAGGIRRLAAARATKLAGITIVAATSQPLIADYADEVVVLDGGRIAERGRPEHLLAAGGLFATLTLGWRAGLGGH